MAPRVWNPSLPAHDAATPALPRATLDGLEVQDSSFDHWLQSGGERRRRPRHQGSLADRGHVELDTSVDATGWDRVTSTVLRG